MKKPVAEAVKKPEAMRATRNATKNTPPAKKAGKATPSVAKSAIAEKQEQTPAEEAKQVEVITVDIEAEAVSFQTIEADGGPNTNGEAKAAVTAASAEAIKAKPEAVKKKVATPKKKASDAAEREVENRKEEPIASTANAVVKPETVKKEAPRAARKEDAKESKDQVKDLTKHPKEEDATEQPRAQVSVPSEMEVEAADEDEEMAEEEVEDVEEEYDEDEEEGEGVENEEDVENEGEEEEVEEEEEEVEEEEIDEGDEEGVEEEEEEEEGDDIEAEELLEQRPVTERQKRKKLEVFVGGLDKDATDDDVRKAFEVVGEVVEIRLMRHPQTGKNKGYAFVRFATVDQAKKAATELERTKIRDKECGVVPSEDNDTLFLGNVCKTWKSEQVLEKLKDYGVEGIEEFTLMGDPQNEELSRGFAFVELATHNDAVKAFKRLSRPDAIFGFDRSAKVAWAEPTEPDEEVMAKVKSVFVDGMPSSWEEAKVKEYFGKFGDIDRVVLAKNMPRSRREDFAFVNYATREAAVACVEAFKDGELSDGDNKVKVKVALAKPAPRKKHMKGSRGGYPVGGRPAGRGRGFVPRGGYFNPRRGRGGRGFPRGGRMGRGGGRRLYDEASVQKIIRAVRQQVNDERRLPEERSRDRRIPGVRGGHKVAAAGAGVARPLRGAARGAYPRREDMNYSQEGQLGRPNYEYGSQRGRGSFLRRGGGGGGGGYRDDYVPQGARDSPGLPRPRGYSSRPPPREDAYPRRLNRGPAYARDLDGGYGPGARDYGEGGSGIKRPYSALDEDTAYYESGRRGYPRSRVDYADPGPVGGPHYSEPVRAPLGRSSLGGRNALPAVGGGSVTQTSLSIYDQPSSGLGGVSLGNTGSSSLYSSGGQGYSSVISGAGDYVSGTGELRGGSYASSLYGSRSGSGYGLPSGGGSGSYY